MDPAARTNPPIDNDLRESQSESEDEIDEMTQMLMKSSTKHFNHVNCQQSRLHTPFLCQARPEGQSFLTKEQSILLRKRGTLTRLTKSRYLERQLTKDLSAGSSNTLVAKPSSSSRALTARRPSTSVRSMTAVMIKSKSNNAKSIKEQSTRRSLKTYRNINTSFFEQNDI